MEIERTGLIPLGDLKANFVGGTGTYNVDLRNFKCDCNTFACKHLSSTAQYYSIALKVMYIFKNRYIKNER